MDEEKDGRDHIDKEEQDEVNVDIVRRYQTDHRDGQDGRSHHLAVVNQCPRVNYGQPFENDCHLQVALILANWNQRGDTDSTGNHAKN